jgi:hypothetical protein
MHSFGQKWFGLHFGRFFQKNTHLVTLILGGVGGAVFLQ